MRLAAIISLLAAPVAAQTFEAPSGLAVEVGEVLLEEDTGFARFRFVAPSLGQEGATFADVEDDFGWMCETFAVPALNANAWEPQQIIISIADRDVPFGTLDPDATQFFTGFSTDGETCTEELF